MGRFDKLFGEDKDSHIREGGHTTGAVQYGKNKQDGSHDHRGNRGNDRTPAQKQGDRARTKND
jgi:hypothetical protein